MPYLLCFSFANIPAVFPFVKGFLHIFMQILSEYSRFPATGGRDKSLPYGLVGCIMNGFDVQSSFITRLKLMSVSSCSKRMTPNS